jgi:hypothetical protein
MAMLKIFVCLATLIALYAQAQAGTLVMDKVETINGVALQTGKKDSIRTYQGRVSKTLAFPLESVKKGVVNFTEKCNNKFKDKRKYTDKNADCKYHNENVVESFIVRDLKPDFTKENGEVERFLIGRQVYNRGSFGYYELVRIFDGVNSKGQKTIMVVQKMLEDKEVKEYISPKFDKESAFDKSTGVFTLTMLGPKETELTYDYKADTDHWILNKEVSIPQVFSSISKSINDLVRTVDTESNLQSRDLASHQ